MNRRNFIRNALIGGAGLAATAGGGIFFYTRQPQFGRPPSGARLKKILNSPHYFGDHFECLTPVKIMSDDAPEKDNRLTATWKFLFGDKTGRIPPAPVPTVKTDLKNLDADDCAIWMGHSTIYLQLAGRKILIDPVFSDYASPIFFVNRAFAGTNIYTPEDFPAIDILAITHDHWDHLDYPTIMGLKPKIKTVLCPLGVGEYFEQWGFDAEKIIEDDWDSMIDFGHGLTAHILPSQHFSGRLLTQNPTQWCAFAFVTAARKIFCSGDGGYSNHFRDIGKKFGYFDLAFLENGQYNRAWHAIHLLPNETAQAAEDINAVRVVPIHAGKFALAYHEWNAPYKALLAESYEKDFELLTPRIGELIRADAVDQKFPNWFEFEEE